MRGLVNNQDDKREEQYTQQESPNGEVDAGRILDRGSYIVAAARGARIGPGDAPANETLPGLRRRLLLQSAQRRLLQLVEVEPVNLLSLAERGGTQTTRLYSPLTEKPTSDRPSRGPASKQQNTRPSGGHGVRRSRQLGAPAAVAGVTRAA